MRKIFVACMITAATLLLAGCESEEERAESHYKRGVELIEDGELLKARLELRNALGIDQKHGAALYKLGEVEQRLGNFQGAANIFLRVADTDPEHLDARLNLAGILLAAGKIEDALKYSEQAYALKPQDSRVLILKGSLALRLEKPDEAAELADLVLKEDPHNLDALMLRAAERINAGDNKGALTFLDRGEEKSARNVMLQLFRLRTFGALQDRESIEGVLKKLIGFYPENVRLRYGLAQWYRNTDRKPEAEEVLRAVARDFPKDEEAGRTLVAYLAQEKGFEAARAELLERIEASKGSFVYQRLLAELAFSARKDEEAFSTLEGVIASRGTESEGLQAKVLLAQMKADRQDLPAAQSLASEVLEQDAKNADALAVRSFVHIANKDYPQAIEDLSTALDVESGSVRVRQLLARAYELNGSTELAEEHLAKAVQADGFKPGIGLVYVQFLLRHGKGEQADRILTQIRRVAPANRQVLTLLGRIKLSRQDWLGAQEIAEAIRKLDDSDQVADRILAEVLSGQRKYEESNALLKSTLADASSDSAPLARYIDNLVRSGEKEQAIAFLEDILSKDDDNLRARLLLATVHEVDGKLDLAESEFNAAAERDTENVVGLDALARFRIRRGRLEDAEQTVRTALGRQEGNLQLRMLLANLLERTEQFDKAIGEYRIMFEASPQSTVVANNLASLLADHGTKPEDLEEAYSIAVRFSGSDIPYFQDTLGWIHYLKKDYEQAANLLKPAAEQLTNVGVVQYHLGMTYKALGQDAVAIEQLEKAVKLGEAQQFAQLDDAEAALQQLREAAPQE